MCDASRAAMSVGAASEKLALKIVRLLILCSYGLCGVRATGMRPGAYESQLRGMDPGVKLLSMSKHSTKRLSYRLRRYHW